MRMIVVGCVMALAGGCAEIPAGRTGARGAATQLRTVASGTNQQIGFFDFVNPDCTPGALPVVRLLKAPRNGHVSIKEEADYPGFSKDNQRYPCNLHKTPGVALFYVSNPGYVGEESFAVETFFPYGGYTTTQYSVVVK